MSQLPGFTLPDNTGPDRTFPAGRPSLLAFVKEDCPTCGLSMPLIEAAHTAFGEGVDVLAIGQEAEGNAVLVERHALATPMLDDSALQASYAYDLDTVPTVILADGAGGELKRFVGFGRDDWRTLFGDLATMTGLEPPATDWDTYPESRPGCGSRSVEPGIAERLAAEAEGSPLRARRIEVGRDDDLHEFLYDQGLTDGLPVIPPTPERVLRMLAGTTRDAQDLVAIIPPNLAPATIEKVAINAVMAGCKPEYLPVVITAIEACCTEEFNAHGVWATTMGAAPAVIVNGPIRHRLGMNMQLGAMGQGNRANAAIGRALRLVMRNVGGARPGGTERSTLGTPMKYTLAFAEWEERSPWEPMHVEKGFEPDDDVVSVFPATSGPQILVDQTARTARGLVGSLGLTMASVGHAKTPTGHVLFVVCPEHVDTIWRDRWSKQQIREYIQEVTAMPLRDRLATADAGGIEASSFGPDGPSEEQLAEPMSKFRSTDSIHMVVAGSEAGKFSAVLGGWASAPVSRKIEG